jgi:hypothetical protein
MTLDPMDNVATFDSWAEAKRAADAAMPRRKHNRPYPLASGYEWARAGRPRHDVFIVLTGNIVLMSDGSMFDYQRRVTVRA